MGHEEIQAVAESYSPQERQSLLGLAAEYRRRNEREVLELGALAADVSADDVLNLGLEPESNPQLLEAFRLQYPRVAEKLLKGASKDELEDAGYLREQLAELLRGESEDELGGWERGVKGKYFEVLVRDRLNDGESVGGLSLEPGQVARLAESPTQQGWDVEIVNQDGTRDEALQLKATESMSYVKAALDKNPDIRVVVPSELGDEAAASEDLVSTDISNHSLEEDYGDQLGELGEGVFEDALHQAGELAFDSIPEVSALLIVASEGRQVLTGRYTVKEALKRSRGRLGKSVAFSSIGAVINTTPAAPISVPTTVALRIAEGRMSRRVGLGQVLEARTAELLQLTHQA